MSQDFATVQAEIRKSMAPARNDPAASEATCVDCGIRFWDWTEKWRTYCADCGAERMRATWARRRKGAASLTTKGTPPNPMLS